MATLIDWVHQQQRRFTSLGPAERRAQPKELSMATQTWQIDPTHTSIGFTVRHMVIAKVHGRFTGFEGTVVMEDDRVTSAEVRIDAASIDTQVKARDEHLRSADFFDVANHPSITFRSTRLEPAGKGRYRLTGDLGLHGVTREVAIEAEFLGAMKDPFGVERVAFSGSTSIERKDFGLNWNQAVEAGGVLVGDRIDIQLEVQAVQAAATEAA
jgi:polyisoprenoid-binding protein YceI